MEKTEKKSAEEILDKLLIARGEHPTRVRNPLYGEERKLAKDFAAQELNDCKAKLRAKVMDISKYDEDLKMKVIELIDNL